MQTANPGEVEILAVLHVLYRHRLKIILATLLATALGMGALLVLPPSYTSENIFVVTGKGSRDNPLEQWGMLAEQFGFRMTKSQDPLLTMLDRVVASEAFYAGFVGLSVNPAHPEDSSLIRLLNLEHVPPGLRAKALTSKVVRVLEFYQNKDQSFSIEVKTKSAPLSRFLANQIAAHLNQFFLDRAKAELGRKIAFLTGELAANRRELDSLSTRLRTFLEANREFSSPLLNFRYKELEQALLFANEKYMLTMKAHQTLKISASQPEFFFESISPAEEAGPPSLSTKAKWAAMIFAGSLFLVCAGVIFSQWLLRVSWTPPERG